MGQQNSHHIVVCTACRHRGSACRLGYRLIECLRKAIDAAGDSVAEDFAISGTTAMATCSRPCTVAFHATRDAAYVFGDVAEGDDIGDLVAYAEACRSEQDRGRPAPRMPGTPPAAMIVTGADGRILS